MIHSTKEIHQMDDCARWLKERGISAEVGIDYIYIKYEKSTHYAIKDRSVPFDFLAELKEAINCEFHISTFIPDPTDNSFPWYLRKKIIDEKGMLLTLNCRRFGDSGGPVYTEDF
jgi:hypothetical protein